MSSFMFALLVLLLPTGTGGLWHSKDGNRRAEEPTTNKPENGWYGDATKQKYTHTHVYIIVYLFISHVS